MLFSLAKRLHQVFKALACDCSYVRGQHVGTAPFQADLEQATPQEAGRQA